MTLPRKISLPPLILQDWEDRIKVSDQNQSFNKKDNREAK